MKYLGITDHILKPINKINHAKIQGGFMAQDIQFLMNNNQAVELNFKNLQL